MALMGRATSIVNETERAQRERSVLVICLFLGPWFLASLVAGGVYRVVCGGQRFVLRGFFNNDIFEVGFWLVVASLLAWRIREPCARLAFAILAIQQVILASASIVNTPVSPWLIGSMSVAFGVLVTASGASTQPRWRMIVPALFAAMFIFRWVTLYFADGLIGRHSVFRTGPFC